MKHWCLALSLIVPLACLSQTQADDPVFSGPQAGEALPPLPVTSVLGKTAGQEVDLIERAEGGPVLLVFVHERTRPAFGLANTLMRYAATRAEDGLHSGVVFLTEDATKTAQWMRVVEKHFSPEAVVYGIAPEGREGPGAYGLNRNMALTILVGTGGKVTANYALVQPSEQADGPKILKDIVEAMGGGQVPTIAELGGGQYRMPAQMMLRSDKIDAKLSGMMRRLINPKTTDQQIAGITKRIDAYVADNADARKQLGQIASRVVASKRLDLYGTKAAQEALVKWAKAHGDSEKEKSEEKSASETKSAE